MKNIKSTLAAGLLMALGPMVANATLVTGHVEGYTYDSNIYANGTAVRVDFTYDTEAAPVPNCYNSPGYWAFCDYLDNDGADWLTSTVTIGSDTYEFGLIGVEFREVFVLDGIPDGNGVNEYDQFYVQQSDRLDESVDGVTIFDSRSYFATFYSFLVDIINGTALPTYLDLASGPDIVGEGYWQRTLSISDIRNPGEEEYLYEYAGFSFERLILAPDVVDTPEPTTLALLGLGLVGMGLRRRKVA